MLTLTLQVSSARLSARIFPSPPHNLASSSSASSGPSSPRTEERHAALQPVAEACAEVIPRADKARHQNGYPYRILLDALCAVLDSFCATRESAIALKQVRTITVIRDSFDAHYGVRLTSVAAAQRVLDSLKSEDGSMPLDMQFRYGGVFADDRFTFFEEAAMEQIPKNKRANIWTQMDMCLSLLTGQARPSSKKEAVSSYWAKKYTLANCRVLHGLPSLWCDLVATHIGLKEWAPVLLLGDDHDVLLYPSDRTLSSSASWQRIHSPPQHIPADASLPSRWPRKLYAKRFLGNGIARAAVCKQFANSNWKVFTHLTDAVPIGGSIGMDSKTFCITASHESDPKIRYFEHGIPVKIPADLRACVRITVEGQAMCALSSLIDLLHQAAGPQDRKRVPAWPASMIMLGPAATPSIYANVLMTRIQTAGTRGDDANDLSRQEAASRSSMDVIDEATLAGAACWSMMALKEDASLPAPFIAQQEKGVEDDLHYIYRGLWVEHRRLCRALPHLVDSRSAKTHTVPR